MSALTRLGHRLEQHRSGVQSNPIRRSNALLVVGVVLAAMVFVASAQASSAARAGRETLTPTLAAYPAWDHSPLTASQIAAEVAVPKSLQGTTGKLQLTKADYTNGLGGVAVSPSEVGAGILISGESVDFQGNSYFKVDSGKPTSGATTALKKLKPAFKYATKVTCEGYTDYSPDAKTKVSTEIALTRAKNVCSALHAQDPQISTKTISYGSARPAIIGGTTHAQRAINRRVVIDITASSVGFPQAPALTSATGVNAAINLAITAPASTLAITGYQYTLNEGSTWVTLPTTGTGSLTATISDLANGRLYLVGVRDMTAAGISAGSEYLSAAPQAATVPDAPTITSAYDNFADAMNDHYITVSWTAGADNGSSVLTWSYASSFSTGVNLLSGVAEDDGTYSATFDSGLAFCESGEDTITLYETNGVGISPASTPFVVDLSSEPQAAAAGRPRGFGC